MKSLSLHDNNFQQPPESQRESLVERARRRATEEREGNRPNFWHPIEIDDAIEGVIVKIVDAGGQYNSRHYYIKKTDDGKIQIVSAPKNSTLRKKLAKLNVQVRGRIGIVYLGEKPSTKSNFMFKDWAIEYEGPVQEPSLPIDDDIPF